MADTSLPELATLPSFQVFQRVGGSPRGLTEAEAAERLRRFGENQEFRPGGDGLAASALAAVRSPFVALLAVLAVVFVIVGDARGAAMVGIIDALAVLLRIWQHTRSARAAGELHKLVTSTVTVRRRADDTADRMDREVPTGDLVPGDVVLLQAGDVVAADLRLVSAVDLMVDQSVLTGESLPTAKSADVAPSATPRALADTPSLCFSGSTVVAGKATAVVLATGRHTYFGSLAAGAVALRPTSSFDLGVRAVGWTLIRLMLVLAPIVFVVNGCVSGVWDQAAMFGVAVAVGLTPEMLPVIVTTNLARGAAKLARERVVVSRLNAIQDLGAMDVLCVDKTGTLTEDRIVYAHGIDVTGRYDDAVTELAFLAAFFQDGVHDRMDEAILEMLAEQGMSVLADAAYTKVDEIGADDDRGTASVVLRRQPGEHLLICKGDPNAVLALCTHARLDGVDAALGPDLLAEATDLVAAYRKQGMRVMAVAVRALPARLEHYGYADERDLVLAGFIGFVDPVRASAAGAVANLAAHGVRVKILTGDSPVVARHVARLVGVPTDQVVLGDQVDRCSDRRLRTLVSHAAVFAGLAPEHKVRIVVALRESGCAVGYLGDGVNDVVALRTADAGIAADTATDAAKAAADLILLDKDLGVLADAVVEGRRTLANTLKYVKITAASNFGNVLSVLVASVVLPFLPMLPIQLMVQNLLYDCAQLALPWDRVDRDYLRAPRRWQSRGLASFMLTFGPLSSAFDLITFAVLWWGYGAGDVPSTFQTGWFIEGLLSQLAVVLVLRSRVAPWRGERAAPVVVVAALAAAAIGLALPYSPLGAPLRLTPLPLPCVLWLLLIVLGYAAAAQCVKHFQRKQNWL
ncbi:magnesium-translocating P-type ATPase [Mycolicibacterium sp. 120266]|uniref:magnesium-translocating P-type ATPase n=1 Tax=Mycolicibacterium sp. 120266 TaxID=3090601 RepID=UPI00299E30BF|nr:magnesium-translocating P-type ATPase [Mycolicibacterium sp. 120266]MDX1875440.1 magnesium-translocating P-type ATPase [Mycolicibacterium sp. 120266]